MKIVYLSHERKCELWAAAKAKASLPGISNSRTRKRYKGDGEEDAIRNYIGNLGEAAVAKQLGIEYTPKAHGGRDAGYDLVYDGVRIGIKTSKYRKPQLFVKESEPRNSDVYVLCSVNKETGAIMIDGWIEASEVYSRPVSDFKGYGLPCYEVKNKEMKDWNDGPWPIGKASGS